MRNFRLILLYAGIMLMSLQATAQTLPAEPQPGGTPDPLDRTAKTEPTKTIDPETVIEFGGSYEDLTRNRPAWETYYFSLSHKFSSGQVIYGTASAVSRFQATDPNLMIGLVQPLGESKRWMATFEASGSPHHEILPTVSFFGQVEHLLGKGWVARAGLRHGRHPSDTVNIGIFGAEKYYKAYRGAYTLYVAHLNGRGTAASHAFQGNYYYGERNSIGAGFAFGTEIESVPFGLIRTDVLDVSFTGRHWISNRWGLSYVAVWHRQGIAYTRRGAQVGLLLRF